MISLPSTPCLKARAAASRSAKSVSRAPRLLISAQPGFICGFCLRTYQNQCQERVRFGLGQRKGGRGKQVPLCRRFSWFCVRLGGLCARGFTCQGVCGYMWCGGDLWWVIRGVQDEALGGGVAVNVDLLCAVSVTPCCCMPAVPYILYFIYMLLYDGCTLYITTFFIYMHTVHRPLLTLNHHLLALPITTSFCKIASSLRQCAADYVACMYRNRLLRSRHCSTISGVKHASDSVSSDQKDRLRDLF